MNTSNFRLPVDFFFIDKVVEPLTQKIQKYFGLDCFFWAKIYLWICQIFSAVSITFSLLMLLVSLGRLSPFWIFVSLVSSSIQSLIFHYHWIILRSQAIGLPQFKKIAYKAVENGERNPLTLIPRSLLTTAMWFIVVPFFYLASSTWWEDLIDCVWKAPFVFGYFAQCLYSCTPLPPKKSVLRAKIEVMQELFTQGFGGGPEPEPA